MPMLGLDCVHDMKVQAEQELFRAWKRKYPRGSEGYERFGADADTVRQYEEAGKGRLTPAERDIIEVIREAGHRLTTKEVLAALEAKRGAASEGTTKQYLASLVRSGLLTNRQDLEPKGYGLPGWG